MSELGRLFGLALVAASFLLAAAREQRPDSSQPDAAPPSQLSVELDNAFSSDRQSAVFWSGMLSGIARFVASDGASDKPLLVTMYDVDAVRRAAVAAPVEGVPGGMTIGQVLSPYLDRIGKGAEKLEEGGRRQKVVDVFLEASHALKD